MNMSSSQDRLPGRPMGLWAKAWDEGDQQGGETKSKKMEDWLILNQEDLAEKYGLGEPVAANMIYTKYRSAFL